MLMIVTLCIVITFVIVFHYLVKPSVKIFVFNQSIYVYIYILVLYSALIGVIFAQ